MVTVHIMGLRSEPFEKIRGGKKTIELRLFDEKRKTIQLGDIIEFHKTTGRAEGVTSRSDRSPTISNVRGTF